MATPERQDPRQLLTRMDGRFRDQEVAEWFGRNLLKARRRAGFSQEELGRLTSVHRTHIGFTEAGHRLPRADSLVKLTSALAVEADELLQGIDWIVTTPTRPGSFDFNDTHKPSSTKEDKR